MAGGGFGGVEAILAGKRSDDDDFFKILGCTETSTDEQIIAEYRVRALQCHPDKHPNDHKALEQFQKLQEAKQTLLDPEKRQKYDKWKASEMCIPYKQWLSMSNRCATTMHWAKPKDQTMIESLSDHRKREISAEFQDSTAPSTPASQQSTTSSSSNLVWRPDQNTTSIYAKFRNYKI